MIIATAEFKFQEMTDQFFRFRKNITLVSRSYPNNCLRRKKFLQNRGYF